MTVGNYGTLTGSLVIPWVGNFQWVVPENVAYIRVLVVGGGGGGAGGYVNGGVGSGGGGAGGVATMEKFPVTPGDIYNVETGGGGAGGVGGTNRYSNGQNGGATYFYKQGDGRQNLLYASGGNGGSGASAGANGSGGSGPTASGRSPLVYSGLAAGNGYRESGISHGGHGGDSSRVSSGQAINQPWAIAMGMTSSLGNCGDSNGYYGGLGGYPGRGKGCNYAGTDMNGVTQHGIYGGGGGGGISAAGNGGDGVVTIQVFAQAPDPVNSATIVQATSNAVIDGNVSSVNANIMSHDQPISMSQIACRGGARTFRFPSNFQAYITKRGANADSGLQGYMGWKYGYTYDSTRRVRWYDPTSQYKNQTLFRGPQFTGAPLFPFLNTQGHLHPHSGMLNVVRWQAPTTGRIRFLGHIQTVNHAGGNGTVYWLGKMRTDGGTANSSNRTETLASKHLRGGTGGYYGTEIPTLATTEVDGNRPWDLFNVVREVKAGDTFYLVLGPNADPSYDSTFLNMTIYYENAEAIKGQLSGARLSLREQTEDMGRFQTVMPRYAERRNGQTTTVGNQYHDKGTGDNKGIRMSEWVDSTWIPAPVNTAFSWDTAAYDNVGNGALKVNLDYAMNGLQWWNGGVNGNVVSSAFRLKNMRVPDGVLFPQTSDGGVNIEKNWQTSNNGRRASTGGLNTVFNGLIGGHYRTEYEIRWNTPSSRRVASRGVGNTSNYVFNSTWNSLLKINPINTEFGLVQNYGTAGGLKQLPIPPIPTTPVINAVYTGQGYRYGTGADPASVEYPLADRHAGNPMHYANCRWNADLGWKVYKLNGVLYIALGVGSAVNHGNGDPASLEFATPESVNQRYKDKGWAGLFQEITRLPLVSDGAWVYGTTQYRIWPNQTSTVGAWFNIGISHYGVPQPNGTDVASRWMVAAKKDGNSITVRLNQGKYGTGDTGSTMTLNALNCAMQKISGSSTEYATFNYV